MAIPRTSPRPGAAGDPQWYKDAIVYQIHVRAFHDSNADGIGDFGGLTAKLDYLQDLGVTALWLLPFYPSPLRDDGYDIADYTEVHPDYGTLQDFKIFLREAHGRGLRVITELVLNHTSDQHPWFQRARRAPAGSAERNFYVWSDTPDRYRGTRIIFKDFEPSNWAWDPQAQAYYWHRFYSHQPDLNFDHPEVHRAMIRILDFWLKLGVDGLRLDAVPYLYEREGTSCENLPETHQFLKTLRRHVDRHYQDRMLLAEANMWPEDAVAYFGSGDECHMAFHFPVMPRLFMAMRMEDRFPIIDILQQTPAIPDGCQWALFLRNHDELTLEMVTDEDRDYMYRVYAADPKARINLGIRRRLTPLLNNDRRKIELMYALLVSLPGTPILYYGDEIGMGDNIYLGDRNGVRTPMQWSADRNAGFSRANPQRLYLPVIIDPEFHAEAINVEAQQNNPTSLLWWIKRLVALRKRYRSFGAGSFEFLHPDNRKVLAFVRRWQDETILMLANLSRFAQYVALDLAPWRGLVPVELFGRQPFPAVGDAPYVLTLGPHTFYWFSLERPVAPAAPAEPGELPLVVVEDSWTQVLRGRAAAPLERHLPRYLRSCRWFGGKARQLTEIRWLDAIALGKAFGEAQLGLLRAEYTEGEAETYVLPLAFASGDDAQRLFDERPQTVVLRLRVERGGAPVAEGLLYDPLGERRFSAALLDAIARRRRFAGAMGELVADPDPPLRQLWPAGEPAPEPIPLRAEQSNSSVLYGDRFVLKLYRRLDDGVNPELEIGRFLSERTSFAHVPRVAGALELVQRRGEPRTVGLLQTFVPNEGDAWRYTLDAMGRYFDRALALAAQRLEARLPGGTLHVADHVDDAPDEFVHRTIGTYLASATLLGQRTAELHVALASGTEDPAFAPEPFPPHYQRSLYQSMRSLTRAGLDLLRRQLSGLPGPARATAERVLAREEEIDRRLAAVRRTGQALRIRCHGDYHLGQVLHTGRDFVIIDFEGEPARSISERRIKRPPVRDVAGMLRSFHYASVFALIRERVRPEDVPTLTPWARYWQHWVSVAFFQAWLAVAEPAGLLPADRATLRALVDLYLLEKSFYELQYELNNRPEWVGVPLDGILQLLDQSATGAP